MRAKDDRGPILRPTIQESGVRLTRCGGVWDQAAVGYDAEHRRMRNAVCRQNVRNDEFVANDRIPETVHPKATVCVGEIRDEKRGVVAVEPVHGRRRRSEAQPPRAKPFAPRDRAAENELRPDLADESDGAPGPEFQPPLRPDVVFDAEPRKECVGHVGTS